MSSESASAANTEPFDNSNCDRSSQLNISSSSSMPQTSPSTGASSVRPGKVRFAVRPALSCDASAVSSIARQTFCDTFAHLYTEADLQAYLAASYSHSRQYSELTDARWRTFVAESEPSAARHDEGEAPQLIGYAQLIIGEPLDCDQKDIEIPAPAELRRIYVSRSAIGLGVGPALMEAAIEEAKRCGVKSLWLGVWENNHRAQAFYKRFGFRRVGQHSFKVGDQLDTDDLLMLNLEP